MRSTGGAQCSACNALKDAERQAEAEDAYVGRLGGGDLELAQAGTPGLSGGGAKKSSKKGAKKGAKPCPSKKGKGKKASGGGLVDDIGALAIPLGLIAAKEGIQYLTHKKASKKKAASSKKVGGGLMEDVANLAIPLGFVAAERVLSSTYDKKKKSKKGASASTAAAAAPKKSSSRRKAPAGRYAAYGGEYPRDLSPGMESFYDDTPPTALDGGPYGGPDSSASASGSSSGTPLPPMPMAMAAPMMGGYNSQLAKAGLVPLSHGGEGSFLDSLMHPLPPSTKGGARTGPTQVGPPKTGGAGTASPAGPPFGPTQVGPPKTGGAGAGTTSPTTGPPKVFGGALLAAQHAQIAAEFRQMAAEIGAFLEKKGKASSAPKAPKTPSAAKAKAKATKPKASAEKKKKPASKKKAAPKK